VAAAGQYAARLRAQRENVSRTVQIGRFRVIGNRRANGREKARRAPGLNASEKPGLTGLFY